MATRAIIIITVYLVAIGIGGISATKYYQWSSDYNNQKPWYEGIDIDSTDITALRLNAQELYRQGDYITALQYYDRILELDPKDQESINNKLSIEDKLSLGN